MALNLPIGVYINTAREKQHITLTSLAKMAGTSKSHLSEIENKNDFPSLELMRRIAKELNDPELLHAYIRKRFPEVNKAYQEAALYSEARRIFKGDRINQALAQITMEMLLSMKDAKKLATETLNNIFIGQDYDKTLAVRLEKILNEFKSIAQDIINGYGRHPKTIVGDD